MTNPNDPPPFYDDLDAARIEAWRMLEEGARDRRSAFHTPTFATIDGDQPRLRTVVLRGADREAGALRFHTDRRSEKTRQIEANPAAALLFYDAGAKVQLRIEGVARLHARDAGAEDAWAETRAQSRACYTSVPDPGTPISSGDAYEATFDCAAPEDGRQNFAAVILEIKTLEWLYLCHRGHRRARFDFETDAASWLTP